MKVIRAISSLLYKTTMTRQSLDEINILAKGHIATFNWKKNKKPKRSSSIALTALIETSTTELIQRLNIKGRSMFRHRYAWQQQPISSPECRLGAPQ
jgi:hypothetical protein